MLKDLGPAVQNLTKLLAKVMLKFLSWNSANMFDIFCWKNVSSLWRNKTNINTSGLKKASYKSYGLFIMS